jgi:hypothetical protein
MEAASNREGLDTLADKRMGERLSIWTHDLDWAAEQAGISKRIKSLKGDEGAAGRSSPGSFPPVPPVLPRRRGPGP